MNLDEAAEGERGCSISDARCDSDTVRVNLKTGTNVGSQVGINYGIINNNYFGFESNLRSETYGLIGNLNDPHCDTQRATDNGNGQERCGDLYIDDDPNLRLLIESYGIRQRQNTMHAEEQIYALKKLSQLEHDFRKLIKQAGGAEQSQPTQRVEHIKRQLVRVEDWKAKIAAEINARRNIPASIGLVHNLRSLDPSGKWHEWPSRLKRPPYCNSGPGTLTLLKSIASQDVVVQSASSDEPNKFLQHFSRCEIEYVSVSQISGVPLPLIAGSLLSNELEGIKALRPCPNPKCHRQHLQICDIDQLTVMKVFIAVVEWAHWRKAQMRSRKGRSFTTAKPFTRHNPNEKPMKVIMSISLNKW